MTQKSLTADLGRNGMVNRVITRSRPVAVEYRVTPLGETRHGPIDALLNWTTANIARVQRAPHGSTTKHNRVALCPERLLGS